MPNRADAVAFVISRWPSRYLRKDALAGGDGLVLAQLLEAELGARSPSEHSTMNVAVSGSN